MQFEFLQQLRPASPTTRELLALGHATVNLVYVRHPRARRYLLRLLPDGTARVTVPRRGTLIEARAFAHRHREWLDRQVRTQAQTPAVELRWLAGTAILFRGERVTLHVHPGPPGHCAQFADQTIPLTTEEADLRPAITAHLRALARREIPPRVAEFARAQGLVVRRVSVRDQRTRWGSCSRNGAVSLNWRLVQMPAAVRDYVIWHELMHLREMNHSPRFWRAVAAVCPDYETARRWLRLHGVHLR